MGDFGTHSISEASLAHWDWFLGLAWKFPSHKFFTSFFYGSESHSICWRGKKKVKRYLAESKRFWESESLKKICYFQIQVGIIDTVCIIDFFQRNGLFHINFYTPPACAICVTFTAFGSANSVRSMRTPRSQEHGGVMMVSAASDIDQLTLVCTINLGGGALERRKASVDQSWPSVIRAIRSGILWEILHQINC